MTDLSPVAQAVFWEFNRAASGKPDDWHYLPAIAAALRAAVDQVVPAILYNVNGEDRAVWETKRKVRNNLLAIADELEALPE
jgi:hypothetical protein